MATPARSAGQVTATLVTTRGELEDAIRILAAHPRVALDIESNGLFRYRAGLCTMQLAADGGPVFVVDTLATPAEPLRALLGADGPPKIVHDVGFDARILAEAGVVLANVLDTSLAARMLGRTATGLAALLAEIGVVVDKKLQHHDWTQRPLRREHLEYLKGDVAHLFALADRLWTEVDEKAIGDAVAEETRYRLEQAARVTPDARPPWVRLKGADRAPKEDWPLLRRLAELREARAKDLDVPPYKVIGPDVLFAIARAKPATPAELEAVKGATNGARARALSRPMLEAVRLGTGEEVPPEDLAWLERPRLAPALGKARRGREQRLTAWRKAEAKRRGVDEQVVLPGHCLQDLADLEEPGGIASVPGLGAFRIARDGAAIEGALREPAPEAADPGPRA